MKPNSSPGIDELNALHGSEPLRGKDGKLIQWCGTATDIEDRKRSQSLLNAEKRTLEMIANGASLSEVLNDLCAAIDAHAPAARSSRTRNRHVIQQ